MSVKTVRSLNYQNLYKLINFHSFGKIVVVIENPSHMISMMKLKILSIFLRLSVKNMFRKYQTHFGQFANILRWCYLLETVYDASEMSEMDDILQILHQMINPQHGKNSFVLPFHSKMDLWKMKKKKRQKSNV